MRNAQYYNMQMRFLQILRIDAYGHVNHYQLRRKYITSYTVRASLTDDIPTTYNKLMSLTSSCYLIWCKTTRHKPLVLHRKTKPLQTNAPSYRFACSGLNMFVYTAYVAPRRPKSERTEGWTDGAIEGRTVTQGTYGPSKGHFKSAAIRPNLLCIKTALGLEQTFNEAKGLFSMEAIILI